MNPGEPPPSFSSAATKTTFHQNNLQIGATSDNHNQDGTINQVFADGVQSMSFSGNQGINSFSNVYSDGQPPSRGAVRPVVLSNPSGGGVYYVSGQPPSLNDVGRREKSQTGPSFTGDPVSGSEAVPGMSLTATNFWMHNPNAFQKDDDDY